MNKRLLLFLIMVSFLIGGFSYGDNLNDVYVIPIHGEINKATYDFVANKLAEIEEVNPEAVIFDINTYGGLIDQAEAIKDLIISLPYTTISYVNNKAESAGVLVTIASEKVAMKNTATIGSAETIPNTEKIMSMWRGFLRDTAQYRGRDVEIIEKMADKDMDIPGISPRGKLINLTSKEAILYGISDYSANNYEDILDYFNIKYGKINRVEENFQVKLAKRISSPYLSTLLITLGLIGLVVEVLSPGFGIGGTISIVSFALYFGGNIMAGNSSWGAVILFITGLILIIIEIIVPGFGLPGISGILLLGAGVVVAMDSFVVAIYSIAIAVFITIIVTYILVKLGMKNKRFNKIVLKTKLNDESGFLADHSKEEYLGKTGITITELRPSGFIEIDGKKLDGLSMGEFIDKEVQIEVSKVEGSKIFVRRK